MSRTVSRDNALALPLEGELDAEPPFLIDGVVIDDAMRARLLANASAALRVIEYDVFRLWTLLLKGDLSANEVRLLVTILRSRGFAPLYPDPEWARVVPRP